MRATGLHRLLVYCGDYKCAHHVKISADRWQDDVRLSDLEPLFVCKTCGHRGGDIRPLFDDSRPPSRQSSHWVDSNFKAWNWSDPARARSVNDYYGVAM
jgi:hypothetical protein